MSENIQFFQYLCKKCTIILLDYSSQQNIFFIMTELILKYYHSPSFRSPGYTNLMYFICLFNYLAVGVVFMLSFISLVTLSHSFP